VGWNVGKVFHRDALVFQFELVHEPRHHRPGMVNLQQYHLEEALVRRACEVRGVDVRWKHKVTGVAAHDDRVDVTVETPDGPYTLACDWLIACDGARSPVRGMLGLESEGQAFRDRFRSHPHAPTSARAFGSTGRSIPASQRRTGRPMFCASTSARLDEERKPERSLPRLRAMLGSDACFEIEWASVYTFQCRRMKRFRHGRVLFAGDAAHLVSPFGARGANSGVQDAENLAWKIDLVVRGLAPDRLLDSYDEECMAAADENIAASTRSTDFITPEARWRARSATRARAAKRHPFARRLSSAAACRHRGAARLAAQHARPRSDFPHGDGAMEPGAPRPTRRSAATAVVAVALPRERLHAAGVRAGAAADAEARRARRCTGHTSRWARAASTTSKACATPCRTSGHRLLRPDQHVCARGRVRPPRVEPRPTPCTRGSMTALNTQPNLDRPDEPTRGCSPRTTASTTRRARRSSRRCCSPTTSAIRM
jgi:2-polyprenyl-6-methoxyphenol hydroxylase-like FAD-dependent oxidoreductase